jgi:hypothetical protein
LELPILTELDIGTSDIKLKREDSNIISDIGIKYYPISHIRHTAMKRLAQWLRGKALACESKGLGIKSSEYDKYHRISDIGMDSDGDTGTLLILE